jgi:hypothetical protein
VYGLVFLLWGVFGYVEVEAYGPWQALQLALSLHLVASLVAMAALAAGLDSGSGASFKPQLLLKVETIKVRDVNVVILVERLAVYCTCSA